MTHDKLESATNNQGFPSVVDWRACLVFNVISRIETLSVATRRADGFKDLRLLDCVEFLPGLVGDEEGL